MRKLLFAASSLALALAVIVPSSVSALGIYPSGKTGVDVSWPNCNISKPKTAFGIVGVNGGLNFSENPCLAKQAGWFSNLSLYVNTGYPGAYRGLDYQSSPKNCEASNLNCLAYNYGYNAALYSLDYAKRLNISSNTWWLDVETENSWLDDVEQNKQAIQGQYDALKNAGIATVGVYSTTYQWGVITGGWKNGWPSWGASTWRTAKQAKTFCTGHEFNGGKTYLIQFLGKIDQNYAC